mmetsp:Transcript_3371/g.6393  ORF Transcript_3371/g.6393 Transcript_3371/m.6393 type:complete len:171 (+) Transcript_3371:95-607(+)
MIRCGHRPLHRAFLSRRLLPFDPSSAAPSPHPLPPSRRFSSPFANGPATPTTARTFKPLRPCVSFTQPASDYLKALISSAPPPTSGILVKYSHSTSGKPRMLFSLSFTCASSVAAEDELGGGEGVDLGDGQVLYVHATAFMKLLGATVDMEGGEIVFRDKGGFVIDPNNS